MNFLLLLLFVLCVFYCAALRYLLKRTQFIRSKRETKMKTNAIFVLKTCHISNENKKDKNVTNMCRKWNYKKKKEKLSGKIVNETNLVCVERISSVITHTILFFISTWLVFFSLHINNFVETFKLKRIIR